MKRRRGAAWTAALVFSVLGNAGVAAEPLAAPEAFERVAFESLDRQGGAPVVLVGHWLAAPATNAPAVALLHGCGGAYDRAGQLAARMLDYGGWLHARGFHVLVVDSLGPRGEREICTQRIGTRTVTQVNRRRDALATLEWLARRPDVDAARIGLIGWSNGGSTVLAATNARDAEVAAARVRPAFAIAFYPGCEAELRRGYEPTAEILMLVGEADDWTPAAPCRALAAVAVGRRPELEAYPNAFHGFDSTVPVRLRKDVPNGARPGAGVHVGGDRDALARSRQRLGAFFSRQ